MDDQIQQLKDELLKVRRENADLKTFIRGQSKNALSMLKTLGGEESMVSGRMSHTGPSMTEVRKDD